MHSIFLSLFLAISPLSEGEQLERLRNLYLEQPTENGFIATNFVKALGRRSKSEAMEWKNSSRLLRQIEQNFNHFCKMQKKHLPYAPPSIPKKIHFIWLGSPLSERRQLVLDSWKNFHPDWEQKIWTDADMDTFVWPDDRLQSLYEEAETFAEKADLMRAVILSDEGGIYSDFDVVCLKKFDDLISSGITFFGGMEGYKEQGLPISVNNALIGAAKGHPIINRLIEIIIENRNMDKNLGPHLRTGPVPLTKAISDYSMQHKKMEKILILPNSYFYPFYFPVLEKRFKGPNLSQYLQKETMVLHLYETSWVLEKYKVF
ncbi:MAG: glycosyltransferase family 32 protein [Chlamydiia bacterium]